MSIPLDYLYHYIENMAEEIDKNILIYRFYPHGSKKITDLGELKSPASWEEKSSKINITCHDQEPLDYFRQVEVDENNVLLKTIKSLSLYDHTMHNLHKLLNVYNKIVLLHSEKRSAHVSHYQNNRCIPIYYWSHAIIALDWFRYAQHITQQKQINKTFLIYNRAWAGTREYRLRFAELLVKLRLEDHCKTSVNPVEPELGIHYNLHQFKNPAWQPQTVLENHFLTSTAHSHYSADFDIEDYEATDIEVVLETLFDDDRLHLTEKSLRPIACGQPFILAGTHGSLEYLRSYGFKTFEHLWDEHYDLIEDSHERLIAIADLMRQIANWDSNTRENKMTQARLVADYNKKHFFSKEFFNLVTTELKDNLTKGIQQIKEEYNPELFIAQHQLRLKHMEFVEILEKESQTFHPAKPSFARMTNFLNALQNSNF